MISPRFIRGLQAYLDYWLVQTADLNDALIHQLNPDFPNLLRVVEKGLVLPETQVAATNLILQAFAWAERAGHISLWQSLINRALPLTEDNRQQFHLLKRQGQLQLQQRQLTAAYQTFLAALSLAEMLASPTALAEAHMNLCQTYHRQGNYQQAEAHGQTALALLLQKNGRQAAIIRQTLGAMAHEQGHYAAAENYFCQALALFEQTSDLVRTKNMLAVMYHQQKDYEKAALTFSEIKELLAGTSNQLEQAELFINLGSLFYDWGQLDKAKSAFEQARTWVQQRPGLIRHEAIIYNNLGWLHYEQGELLAAAKMLQASVRLWRQIEDDLQLASTLGNLADVYTRQHCLKEACHHYQETLQIVTRHPDNIWAVRMHQKYAQKLEKILPEVKQHLWEGKN